MSWVEVGTAPIPAVGAYTAVLGSPFTLPGNVVLGSPLPEVEVGPAPEERFVPIFAVIGEVIPPKPIPPVVIEGVLGPSRPARLVPKRQRVYAEARIKGFLGQVTARAVIVAPVKAVVRVTGFVPTGSGYALVVQPSLALVAARGLPGVVRTGAHAVLPAYIEIATSGAVPVVRASGHVIAPALSSVVQNGTLGRLDARIRVADPPRWEREELWVLGVLDLENLEADAREPVAI